MNLQERIRKVLKEETFIKVSDDKYSNIIKNAVLDYVDFHICGLSVGTLSSVEDIYFVILIVEEQLKWGYRRELQEYLNNIIPLEIFVSLTDGEDCEKYTKGKNIQETFEKKHSLLKTIKDVGLYDFIKMMGISLEEIKSQVGEIPREMLEQFIKDYVSNEGNQYTSVKPDEKIISIDLIVRGNEIIDFIYYDGKFLSFEVTEYANGFSKEETDQYIEGSKNYDYNTIFRIVEKIIKKLVN